jgi:hypothetical protein
MQHSSDVARDQHVGSAPYAGSKNMTVFFAIRHGSFQRLVAGHHRVRKGGDHEFDRASQLSGGQIGAVLRDVADHFVEDPLGPQDAIETGFRDRQQ